MTFDDYVQHVNAFLPRLQAVLPLVHCDVRCSLPTNKGPLFRDCIPGQGVGACTWGFSNHQAVARSSKVIDGLVITLTIDPSWPRADLEAKLPYCVAHEWHHAYRMLHGAWGQTLLDVLAAEGLADHFAHEQTPYEPPWVYPIPEEDLPRWEARARAQEEPYNHEQWFFGKWGFPPWVGYGLAFAVVGRYLDWTDSTAVEHVLTPSQVIWESPCCDRPIDQYALLARILATQQRMNEWTMRLARLQGIPCPTS